MKCGIGGKFVEKEKYEELEIEVIRFDSDDVITTSDLMEG